MGLSVVTIVICDVCGTENKRGQSYADLPEKWATMDVQDNKGLFVAHLFNIILCPACLQKLKDYLLKGMN